MQPAGVETEWEKKRFCPSMVSKTHASLNGPCTTFSHSNKFDNLNEILNTSMINSQLFIKAMNSSATAWLSDYIKLRDVWEKLNNSLNNPIYIYIENTPETEFLTITA